MNSVCRDAAILKDANVEIKRHATRKGIVAGGGATGEIGGHISRVQTETRDAVGAIDSIRSTIAQIEETASSIAAAVEEQGAATGEISRNIQEAASGSQDVTRNIDGVRADAQTSGGAAAELLDSVQEMSRQTEALGDRVDRFLKEISAA